ncbi:hypothetical protein K5D56_01335 [Pseudomonas cichorii]|nr:hypothetical protein [Pseudomonas cichorii]MBX8588008.1 hypothetical protein [Pseudomonas cichorii]
MGNSLALDVLIPLMVLQLTFDLIHQPAIELPPYVFISKSDLLPLYELEA